MYQKFNISQQTYVWIILISIVLIRLMFLGAYPLADTTEARYGEMGRLIIDTGDWITPQISQGVPFWGKPPLSFWLTATSFMLLGINEFAARLPSLLLAVAVIVMVWSTGRFQTNKKTALTACVIMASSIIFWISSGAVMTDQCLMTGTTLSMIAFWHCFKTSGKHAYWWGILFFIGLAIGLMSKGPLAGVLIFLPVIIWSLFGKTPFFTLKRLPWLTGCIIIIVLVVPWYWLAEIKTPGFLDRLLRNYIFQN
ncbi:phospholipid carrier-dependent glycosyltransferase [bacterium]|nr:phospholipid carrier-dependent glycosyltransferase [bacterium]